MRSESGVGSGTFRVVSKKARTGGNPQAGGPIQIPAKNVPEFVAAKGLKESVWS